VARNRKRAKERRARRPNGAVSRSRIAAASAEETPDPLEHAAPDVELADAQLALGRPDLSDAGDAEEAEEEYELESAGTDGGNGELEAADADGGSGGGGRAPIDTGGSGGGAEPPPGAGAIALGPRGVPAEHKVGLFARLIAFLQGSWRELQRVQWPDRRQVAQATSVVIGFVIVAGVFLGLSDLAFSHLMNYILYGK
jgi:preprotein translocase subunit SecE